MMGLLLLANCGGVEGDEMSNIVTPTGNTLWGRTVNLAGATAVPPVQPRDILVRVQLKGDPSSIGIQCGIAKPSGNPFLPATQVTLIVEWGVGGAQNSAEIDLGSGVSFTVFGDYVQVVARNEGLSTPVQVTGTASYGTSGTGGSPTRTVQVGAIAAAAVSASIPIPAYAKKLQYARFGIGGEGDVLVRLERGIILGAFTLNAGVNTPDYILTGFATSVVFDNTLAGSTAIDSSHVTFLLDL